MKVCDDFAEISRRLYSMSLGWHHGKGRKRLAVRGDIDAGKRNQSLACATLRDDRGRATLGEPPHDAHNGDHLGRIGLAQQIPEQRRRRVLATVQRRKRLEDSLPGCTTEMW